MSDILAKIAAYKREEIAAAKRAKPLSALEAEAKAVPPPRGFVAAIDALEDDWTHVIVGSASGGVWKSDNGGTSWTTIFDNYGAASIGDVKINQKNPQLIWVGTGEGHQRNTAAWGDGIYKSTDGGKTWTLMGLEKTQHIGRIVVHPTNPNIVYVAALGAAWKSNPERGLYKTEDGGKTWKLSKFIDDSTGFVDVAMDPRDPNVLYAASYQRVRGPYFLKSGGKGSALWKTTDGGATWTKISGGGWPTTTLGRIGIAISRSNPTSSSRWSRRTRTRTRSR